MITNIREGKSCKEELMLGKASTVIFSKEQGWNRDSTDNKVTEDTSSKDTTEKNVRFARDVVSTANVVSKEIKGKA